MTHFAMIFRRKERRDSDWGAVRLQRGQRRPAETPIDVSSDRTTLTGSE
jgi:hypothetical protein